MGRIKLLALLPVLLIAACGSNKDSVEVTVHTGIPVQAQSPINLSQNLMSLMNVSIGYDCYQDQVYMLVYDNQKHAFIEFKKVKLRSTYNPTPVPAITYGNAPSDVNTAISRILNSSYLDEALTVTIPKGQSIEVGLIGSFFDPMDLNTDGICDQSVGVVAISSTAMMGHTPVNDSAIQAGEIALKIDVMHTNPSASYTLSGYGTRYKDWIETDEKFSYAGNFGLVKSVNLLGAGMMNIKLDNNLAGTKYYLPHMFPMVMEFDYYSAGIAGCYGTYPCGGYYRAVIYGNTGTINATLISTSSGVPFSNFSPTFNVTTY